MTPAARTVSVVALLDRAGRDVLDEARAVDLTRSLARRGLRPVPSLFRILAECGREEWDPAAYDSPGIVAGRGRLGNTSVTLRPAPWLALQGVLITGLVAACVGLYR